MLRSLKNRVTSKLSPATLQWINRVRRPRLGHLPFLRTKPISPGRGFDRGETIDRYYIQQFLAESRRFVRGKCLEVRDDAYTRQFGAGNVERCDVLDINPDNELANIYGDLRHLDAVADETYDCFILTQVLQYIDDVPAALAETHRILKKGGTVLLSVPFIASVEARLPNDYWRFSPAGTRLILAKHFPPENLEVRLLGNFLSSTAFFMGMAMEDLRPKRLDVHSETHGCVVCARATKAG